MAGSKSHQSSRCIDGYRRLGSIYDATLRRDWKIFANCAHPEMPRIALRVGERDPGSAEAGRRVPGLEDGSKRGQTARSALRVSAPLYVQYPILEHPVVQFPILKSPILQSSTSPSLVHRSPEAQPLVVATPLVKAASRVRLWRRDEVASIDLTGVALDNGVDGAEIRVRLAAGGPVLRGIVRGASSVELDSRPATGFTGADR